MGYIGFKRYIGFYDWGAGTPSLANVSATLGASGTAALQAGSIDAEGVILFTIGGASPNYYVQFDLNWSIVTPRSPNIVLQLLDGSNSWFNYSIAKVISVDTSKATCILVNDPAGSALFSAGTYKVQYQAALLNV